jgi:hypothetical protein
MARKAGQLFASPEGHDERSVIARFALAERGFAFISIHENLGATIRHRTRSQCEIDPETPAAVERSRSVVPPRERPGPCLLQA